MKRICILLLSALVALACNEDGSATGADIQDQEFHPKYEPCQPQCEGKTCGDNGCGGTCGNCFTQTHECVDGLCESLEPPCEPDCEGKECGSDGCGGSCGSCNPGVPCPPDGCCLCNPQCDGKECGPDGWGGQCGDCEQLYGEGWTCNAMLGTCEPEPVADCTGKQCGPDGAGGSCGNCPCDGCDMELMDCVDGMCEGPIVLSCSTVLDCCETCPESDQACYLECINGAPIEVQMGYHNLILCLDETGYFACLGEFDENSPELDECRDEALEQCADEYAICGPPGDGTCVDLYLCIIACPEGDAGQVCAQDCFGDASIKALDAWQLFIDCLDANGYFDCPEGDTDCYEAAWDLCDATFKECAHGEDACFEIFGCQEDCAPNDQICFLQCIVYGSIEAQNMFDAIVDCVVEECADDVTPECENQAIEGPCHTLYDECVEG